MKLILFVDFEEINLKLEKDITTSSYNEGWAISLRFGNLNGSIFFLICVWFVWLHCINRKITLSIRFGEQNERKWWEGC